MAAHVDGICEPRFSRVREAFAANFAERGEVGGAVAITLGGRTVVDLWGGTCDEHGAQPWDTSTIANFYSAGKPVIATLLLVELERAGIELDTPVVEVWPEFGQGGKEHATIRHALCHRAGVPAIRRDLSNDDLWCWETMTAALAETTAWFEPGSRHVYHTNTYGHLIGELARRLGGATPHELLERLSAKLGADLHVGVPNADLGRCAHIFLDAASSPAVLPPDDGAEDSMILRGYFNPAGYSSFGVVNSEEWRTAQVPSTNGHGTARGLAAFYSALLDDGRVL